MLYSAGRSAWRGRFQIIRTRPIDFRTILKSKIYTRVLHEDALVSGDLAGQKLNSPRSPMHFGHSAKQFGLAGTRLTSERPNEHALFIILGNCFSLLPKSLRARNRAIFFSKIFQYEIN